MIAISTQTIGEFLMGNRRAFANVMTLALILKQKHGRLALSFSVFIKHIAYCGGQSRAGLTAA